MSVGSHFVNRFAPGQYQGYGTNTLARVPIERARVFGSVATARISLPRSHGAEPVPFLEQLPAAPLIEALSRRGYDIGAEA